MTIEHPISRWAHISMGIMALHFGAGGFKGTARLTRHLSRMCFALSIATGDRRANLERA